jgi:poly(3-hydroxybutyrate) depolymerase
MLFNLVLLATAAQALASGCGAPGFQLDQTGRINRTLPSGRKYLLHVPPEYNAKTPTPLVLSFHGGALD